VTPYYAGINKALTTSAYCQARKRLGLETINLIKDNLVWTLERGVWPDSRKVDM
jgi:hypothetical protein